MNVFLFGNPELYFETIQILFMSTSFYISVWLTVMVSASQNSYWKVISVLPAVVICCLFFSIVKTAGEYVCVCAVWECNVA